MSDEQDPAPQAPAEPPARRGGFMKLVIIALPVFVVTLVAGWWVLGGASRKVEAEESRIEERGVVPLEPFLVNLSDPGGTRFLKVSLQLVFATEAEARHVESNAALMGHARSAILELLTEQKSQVLVTGDGKQKLKDALKAHLATILTKQKVVDVLFSEFVVQF